jgi:uncharacterized membrane protein
VALIGIILQASAGIVYGVSYLIGVERIDKWKESRRAWLADSKNRIKVGYLLTLITPLALAIFANKVSMEVNTPSYAPILGVVASWVITVGIYTSFLLIWSRSKSIADMLKSPRVNQMMQKSSIASIILGIILMAVGGVAIWRLLGLLTTAAIIPAVLLALALTALFIGFILVVMPALYYAYILFVRGVSILLKPGKAVWILALSLYLAGCALLIIHEMHIAG